MKKIFIYAVAMILFSCESKEVVQNKISTLKTEILKLQQHPDLTTYKKSLENLEVSRQKLKDYNQLLNSAKKSNSTVNVVELETGIWAFLLQKRWQEREK